MKNTKMKWYRHLYIQVILGIILGILLGHYYPIIALTLHPLSEGFIRLVKIFIAPLVFITVVTGIASMQQSGQVGRIGIKALVYFEVITSFALLIGLLVGNLYHPGSGSMIDPQALNAQDIAHYVKKPVEGYAANSIVNVIPHTLISAFAEDNILSVLFLAILFGFGIIKAGNKAKLLTDLINSFSAVLFSIMHFIMKLAPIGAFGAMTYAIAKYGIGTLFIMSKLIFAIYLTCFFFIFIVLNVLAKLFQFSLWELLKHIKEELLIVFGTCSSEVVLPQIIDLFGNFHSLSSML